MIIIRLRPQVLMEFSGLQARSYKDIEHISYQQQ